MPYTAIPSGSATLTTLTGLTDKQVVFGSSTGTGTSSADATYDDATNDFSISASESGGTVAIAVANTSNTASSNAAYTATVAGTSANDAVYQAIVSGTTTWSWGVDNSDSDNFKVAPNADVGTSTAITCNTSGEWGIGVAPAAGFKLKVGGAGPSVTVDAASGTAQFIVADSGTAKISLTTAAQTFAAGINIAFATSTGTKIGTNANQLIGFWNATPVAQQVFATGAAHTVDELITLLQTLGLCKQS